MLRTTLLIFACLQSTSLLVDSARILGIFPIPSLSHQVVFRALMLELAKRGHELVIITPNPALAKDRPQDNVTEIDTGQAYELISEMMKQAAGLNQFKRGVVIDADAMISMDSAEGILQLVSFQFEFPEVKKLLEDKTQKFDLVFVEGISNYALIVSHIFKAPAILFSSFYGFPEHLETMGAVSWHPIYYPNFYRNKYHNLTIWEKIKETHLEYKLSQLVKKTQQLEDAMLKKNFGPDAPTIADLRKNVQMLFLNSHPFFNNNRPVPPSIIHLGALHLQPPKDIPQEIKSYLDSSTRGVVYVSFGTNVRPSQMDEDLLDAFLDAFEACPYDILWKFDGDNLKRIPKNVKIQKWFPQRDMLFHKNIKAFVTQGGLQSSDEAIDAAVPLVGIPMLGDQWYNVNKYVELGIGEQLDVLTLTADVLTSTIKKVVENKSYKENMERVRSLMKDQPQTPLERGVWWTEHVLKHGGQHLRAPTFNITWSEYLMADVVLTLLSILIAFLTLVLFLSCKLWRAIKGPVKVKRS
ncbi:unnamed protein product [Chrysodeixis includens]|uniref:UDP-glucuronosyltransferase n=1 Tax=Chrysodeixis includens TaxID=689277 RepID=A0A9P0BJA9_CHRIL|nr:unnamed protein product [Chrysodeixis includens]